MNSCKKTLQHTIIYTLSCLLISNIMWYIGYALYAKDEEHPIAMILIMLTSFMPAFITLIMTKITKEGWESLPLHPHPIAGFKAYVAAIVFTLLLVYLSDPLYLLIFKGNVTYSPDGCSFSGWLQVLLLCLLALAMSVEMLGEELGWMGYLFPKLEQLWGTTAAIALVGLIRSLWHIGILVHMDHPVIGFFDLMISNILCQSLLVYITKKSKSVFPAAVSHGITLLAPIFLVYSEEFYSDHIIAMNLVGLSSALMIGGLCYYLLHRENLIIK
ncbi:MAG: CPBP family intramembrane metalloprotease [Lachnospiraceae bacterium]|nr:CPBP family intramembrane metalloprotease [Lachnospiraceae bacterium]